MYGELHWKPWELSRATWVQVSLAIYGLRERDYMTQSLFRKVAAAVACAGMNNKFASKFEKFWPDTKKKKTNLKSAIDELRRINLKEAKINHGRGIKTNS